MSKGVVTYHFAAKDDLIHEVVHADLQDSVHAFLEARLGRDCARGRVVADYIITSLEYYRTHTRYVLAIREVWSNFRNERGELHFGGEAVAGELSIVQQVLELGQANGSLGTFSARVVAVSMKAALDALLAGLCCARRTRTSTWSC